MTPKERYFQKKFDEAPMVPCACGCGVEIKSVDRYARPKKFVSGHNRQVYAHSEDAAKAAKKRWRKRNPEWVKEEKKTRYRRLKLEYLALKGNECQRCQYGYNGRNAAAFEFHHSDPSTKEGQISQMIINKSRAAVLEELDKCELLCAICHRLHHGGEW